MSSCLRPYQHLNGLFGGFKAFSVHGLVIMPHHTMMKYRSLYLCLGNLPFQNSGMNSMKLVILLHWLYWSIHTKDESKRGTAFAFIFGVN